jgi:hypothetical protein
MTKPSRGLDLLEDNLRRLRAIYIAVTAVGVVLSLAFVLYLQSGGELEGLAIAFSMIGPAFTVIGLALLVPRLRVESPRIVRTLVEEPERIARIGLKRTESTIAGAQAASYEWVVLELTDRSKLEILVRQGDLQAVLTEIRRRAPDAELDKTWHVHRTNVHLS